MTTHRTMVFEPIVTATYRSERSDPRPGQSMYLHLSDLLMAVKRSGTHDPLSVLDYGCAWLSMSIPPSVVPPSLMCFKNLLSPGSLPARPTGVTLHHIQPGKPMQNALIESFNGTFRDDCLNQDWFASLAEARLEHWRSHDYNRLRPHSSIARVPPDVFALPFLNSQPNKSVILNPAAA
jgi:hypothetical protein